MSLPADTIDLSDAIPVESFFLEIIHPATKKPTGWKIELAGPQHANSIAVASEGGDDLIKEEFAVKVAQASGQKYEPDHETLQSRRRKNVGRICRRILGWSPNPTFKNVQPEPIEFSVAAATDLFLRPDMAGFFIQITQYLTAEKAFIQPSDSV
jgi:hypothetical protein